MRVPMLFMILGLGLGACGEESPPNEGCHCGGEEVDAGLAPELDAAVTDAPTPFTGERVVYLNFEGVTIHGGADPIATDATLDVWPADWLVAAEVTVPPYLDGVADRDATIETVVSKLHEVLDPYRVVLVRERPANGPYVMIVFGGLASQVVGFGDATMGTVFEDCGDLNDSDLGFVFDAAELPHEAVTSALFNIFLGVGMDGSSTPENCMCDVASCSPTDYCTLSEQSTTSFSCSGEPVQDQPAFLAQVLGLVE